MTTVWSEVDPALTSYTDCTYCSILMVVAASGFTAFPLGLNTHPERVAFRGGDPRLNFAGGVDRAKARYGITIQSPAPYSKEGLRAALMQSGRAYAIAGRTANFPAGHTLRRWDPTFSGTHAVAYIPDGLGVGQWLDPLAPMGYAGQNVTVSQVVDTFCTGVFPNDARFLTLGDAMPKIDLISYPDGPHTCNIPAGGTVQGWSDTALVKTQTFPTGSSFPADCQVKITSPQPPTGIFYHCTAGTFAGLYVPEPHAVDAGPVLIDPANCPPLAIPEPTPPVPAPVDVATAKAVLLAAGIDIDAAKAELVKQTTNLNRVATARTAAVANRRIAYTKLGGIL